MVSGCTGKRRGNSIIEFSFLIPWFVFVFVGAYDFGFYGYSLIAATAAARSAANYCAYSSTNETACGSSTATACTYAVDSLKYLPNVSTGVTTCGASPIVLTESSGTDTYNNAYVVITMSYTTPQLIPIPGLLPGQVTISRVVTMPVRATG